VFLQSDRGTNPSSQGVVILDQETNLGKTNRGKYSYMTQKLTPEIITAAIDGLESRKVRIDEQIADLRGMLDGNRTEATIEVPEAATHTRKKFSAASRRKMALAQKARWAKLKGESEPTEPAAAPAAPKRKRRKISAAGRKAIAEATRKRWEAFRAAKA
jgi:hypothetical protein